MFTSTIAAAYHESGHILMNYFVGWSIEHTQLIISYEEYENKKHVVGSSSTEYAYGNYENIKNHKDVERMLIRLLGGPIAHMCYNTCSNQIRREDTHKIREHNLLELFKPMSFKGIDIEYDMLKVRDLLTIISPDDIQKGYDFYSSLVYETLVTFPYIRAMHYMVERYFKELVLFPKDVEYITTYYALEASPLYKRESL